MALSTDGVTALVKSAEELAEGALSGQIRGAIVIVIGGEQAFHWTARADMQPHELIGALESVKLEIAARFRERGAGG